MPRSTLKKISYLTSVFGMLFTASYAAWLFQNDRYAEPGLAVPVAFVFGYVLCSLLMIALSGIRKTDVALFSYTLIMMALNGQILYAQQFDLPQPYFATGVAAVGGVLLASIPLYISSVRHAAQVRRASDKMSCESLSATQMAKELGMTPSSNKRGEDSTDRFLLRSHQV